MSAVDQNLGHGQCNLTPDLVLKELKTKPWQNVKEYVYGPERLSPEGEEVESIYDISGAPLPIRAMIIRLLLQEADVEKPWKAWIESESGTGWLVATDKGWRFYHQDFR